MTTVDDAIVSSRRGKLSGTIIINLYKKYLLQQPTMRYIDIMMSLSNDTGIGLTAIKNTIQDYRQKGIVCSPNKKKTSDLSKNVIRRKIHEFWYRREIPTLNKVFIAINEDPCLPTLSRTGLHQVLENLNFELTKSQCIGALTEREDLVLWRRDFIRNIRLYRSEGRTIYYLDETWVNADECADEVRVDETVTSSRDAFLKGLSTGPTNPTDKGKRLMVVHIGSSNGFVEGGLLCIESRKHLAGYREEMDGDSFYDWFCGVLPLLDDNSIIVMDNASYHSVKLDPAPKITWKKHNIIQWLKDKNVVVDRKMVKLELMRKVKKIRTTDKYLIDEKAMESNKIVLRLPPYHLELNPTKLAFSVVKKYVKQNNTTLKLNDVRQLLIDGVKLVTPEMWDNFIKQTIKEEDKMWDLESISDEMLDALDQF
ncbi:hypothetical protein QTP88_026775 [Uroleucon formosanum]